MRWRAISSLLSNARRQSACQPKLYSCIYGGIRQSQPSPPSSSLSGFSSQGISNTTTSTKPSNHSSFVNHSEGILCLLNRQCFLDELRKSRKTKEHAFCVIRSFASRSSSSSNRSRGPANEGMQKDIATSEDPFDSLTYNIPEKPVTFTEGASYSIIILVGLGLAAAAAYAVLKELIFQPKEYKIFGKALERVQNDNQIRVRIGSPITGYGHETRNRNARRHIQNRAWTDEDGVERVEVIFHIRGPHGAGKVYSEMFKDKADKQWKYTYLIVEITSPSPAQLILESYIPA